MRVKTQAAVVDLVKSAGVALNDQFITLAIGDGANDVPMIQRVCMPFARMCACAFSYSHCRTGVSISISCGTCTFMDSYLFPHARLFGKN